MAEKFKLIIWDWFSLVLTVVALVLHFAGFFIKQWWVNSNAVGTSHVGMMSMRICEIACVNKTVLDIEAGREWIFAVRVFEVFGIIFLLIGLLLAILMVTIRRRAIHTALTYVHGAAGVFILVGVFIFLGFHSKMDVKLESEGSLRAPFGLCLVAGLVAIGAAVVTGVALGKHLLEWDDDEDDHEEDDRRQEIPS